MSRSSRLRLGALAFLSALLTLAAAFLAPAGAASAAGSRVILEPGASLAHPFSDPVWWPLRTATMMDCYRGNPGCTSPLYHTGWLMDVVSPDFSTTRPHEPVYAMGAGIVHWGVTSDVHCGGTIPHGRGNWLWIDHGNGVVSWYGHLAWPFSVPNGAYVTPRTQIGLIGNSGYSNCLKYPTMHYIDIAVKTGATNGLNDGNYVQMYHSFACVHGRRQTWPNQINSRWAKWNDVPNSPRGHEHIIPASDATRGCVPTPLPTPNRTASVRLLRSGRAMLTAAWTLPTTGAARASTVVLIQEYHPTIRRWLDLRKHTLSGRATRTTFTALHSRHTFRVQVSFHNSTGYSAPSAWASAVAR